MWKPSSLQTCFPGGAFRCPRLVPCLSLSIPEVFGGLDPGLSGYRTKQGQTSYEHLQSTTRQETEASFVDEVLLAFLLVAKSKVVVRSSPTMCLVLHRNSRAYSATTVLAPDWTPRIGQILCLAKGRLPAHLGFDLETRFQNIVPPLLIQFPNGSKSNPRVMSALHVPCGCVGGAINTDCQSLRPSHYIVNTWMLHIAPYASDDKSRAELPVTRETVSCVF